MKNLLLLVVSIFLSSTCILSAQNKVVHGYVTAFDSIPINGAEVKVSGTKHVVLTDDKGYFAAITKSTDKLKITAQGFYKQNVKVLDKTILAAINLDLKPGARNREIATGYGHIKDSDKIGAMANIQCDDFNFSVYNNIYDLIKGRLPGVEIVNGEVIIRGQNSFYASSAATIIIDGAKATESMLNAIPPSEVKNVSVIKDASAAIYGFQGSNGVLIIETKSAECMVN